jgi:hypothetical protein
MSDSDQVFDDKMGSVADFSADEIYDPSKPIEKYGTQFDQTDMYRLGKDQKLRVSRPLHIHQARPSN